MIPAVYRYEFRPHVPVEEIEGSLVLAIFAVQSLHGESQTRLDAGHAFDLEKRACVIDGSTDVGRDLNRIFLGFIQREFGPDSFRVERLTELPQARDHDPCL